MVNHPSGSHKQSRVALKRCIKTEIRWNLIAGFTVVTGYRRDFLPQALLLLLFFITPSIYRQHTNHTNTNS